MIIDIDSKRSNAFFSHAELKWRKQLEKVIVLFSHTFLISTLDTQTFVRSSVFGSKNAVLSGLECRLSLCQD